MPGPGNRRITAKDADKFLELHSSGLTLNKAAKEVGFDRTSFTKGLKERDPEFAARLRQAQADFLESRREMADDEVDEEVQKDDVPFQVKMFRWKRWNPAYRENHEITHVGHDGGPVQIEARRVVSLGEVVELVRQLGHEPEFGLGSGDPLALLPGPSEILPAPQLSEQAAGSVDSLPGT